MTTFIQIHTLTSHSTHNLNRDDLGSPKSVNFLGQQHGRISSQCLKRSIRSFMKELPNNEMQGAFGIRTRKLPILVKEHLQKNGVSEKLVKLMTTEVASLGQKNKAKDGEELTQLIFVTQQELEEIKKLALTLCQENDDKKLADVKKVFASAINELQKQRKFRDGVDIAMFGRLTTSEVFEDCDAAVQVAHAITTHPVKNQDDFFTAVDDLREEEMGAGHMDEKQFNTGIFYQYATVNFDLLAHNLGKDNLLAQQATSAFLKSFVMALPTGSQNSMAAHQHPFSILITLGNGANSNLSNAFADIPSKGNLLKITTKSLLSEFINEQRFFGDLKKVAQAFLACQNADFLKDTPLDNMTTCPNLTELWNKVNQALQGVQS
ncbi:type I-E CRISPR-associated protein Cas7/Cse4/CasC [Deltaproteobacteria bacterium TL4]